jgi:hypothetical protein
MISSCVLSPFLDIGVLSLLVAISMTNNTTAASRTTTTDPASRYHVSPTSICAGSKIPIVRIVLELVRHGSRLTKDRFSPTRIQSIGNIVMGTKPLNVFRCSVQLPDRHSQKSIGTRRKGKRKPRRDRFSSSYIHRSGGEFPPSSLIYSSMTRIIMVMMWRRWRR